MAERSGDVLMKFVQKNGEAVRAEATSTLGTEDTLLSEFLAGKFFEIEDFAFGLNVDEGEARGNAAAPVAAHPNGSAAGKPASTSRVTRFSSWRNLTRQDLSGSETLPYPIVLEPFSFTRLVDRASPIFFHSCCNVVSFLSAALVKRKVTGAQLALQSYLRIDFHDVLIIGLDWDDGHIIKEKCKFICREMKVQYRQQRSDGTLGAPGSAEWSRELALKNKA